MPCTDVNSGAPMPHFLDSLGMGYQVLNFRSRANHVFKMSRMHDCLQIAQHI